MNKKLIVWVAVVAVLVTAGAVVKMMNTSDLEASAATWEKISQDQMLIEMEKSDVTIVDLREPALYSEAHVPGAINIPFDEFQSRYKELDKEKRIVFICHTGPMGDASSQFLLGRGYSSVANLTGGMAQWNGPVTGATK